MNPSDEIEPPSDWKPARDIPGWILAGGLLALFVLFQWRRGLPAVTTAEGTAWTSPYSNQAQYADRSLGAGRVDDAGDVSRTVEFQDWFGGRGG